MNIDELIEKYESEYKKLYERAWAKETQLPKHKEFKQFLIGRYCEIEQFIQDLKELKDKCDLSEQDIKEIKNLKYLQQMKRSGL